MTSNKERDCIEISHQARLAAVKTRLVELEKNGIPFDSPISGIAGGIEWKENIGGRIVQVALLPFVIVFILVQFTVTPIIYVLHLRKAHQTKKELEGEVREIETESLSDQVPDEKDVESLWRLHGLGEREYSLDIRLTLLDTWIGILYGKDVSKNIGLRARGEVIAERRVKINLPYYQGKEDAAHFRLASPVDTLLSQLSVELPPYQ